MSMKRNISVLALVLSLSACATYQENPNYQYSSKYNPQGEPIVLAEHTSPQDNQVTPYRTAPVSQSQTIIASSPTHTSTYAASPYTGQVSVTSQTSGATTLQSAPTDTAYAGQALEGTPGYGIYQPEAVEYDYRDNIVSTGVQLPQADSEMRASGLGAPTTQVAPSMPMGMADGYTVRQGDTVYSLARQLCVGVHEISGINNLGADYGIKIGQNLSLPASRC